MVGPDTQLSWDDYQKFHSHALMSALEDRRRKAAEQEAAARRATERQILEDADHLITVWN
jgi:hypothetical protein